MFDHPELAESSTASSRPQTTVKVSSDQGTIDIPEAMV